YGLARPGLMREFGACPHGVRHPLVAERGERLPKRRVKPHVRRLCHGPEQGVPQKRVRLRKLFAHHLVHCLRPFSAKRGRENEAGTPLPRPSANLRQTSVARYAAAAAASGTACFPPDNSARHST